MPGSVTYLATLTGIGAIVQGGGTAVGAGGVYVGGQNTGKNNTGTQTNTDTGGDINITGDVYTGGGHFAGGNMTIHGISPQDLEPLFAPFLAGIAQHSPPDKQIAATQQAQELKSEIAKGKQADDGKIARIVEGLTEMVPGAIKSVVSLFATPIISGIAGPVTKWVLDKLKTS